MSKLYDNLTFTSEVTEILVKQLLSFSKQWKEFRVLIKHWLEIYINSNFKHLLASNFPESLFLKFSNGYKISRDPLDVYFSQFFSKISETNVVSWTTYFINLKLLSASRLFCTETKKYNPHFRLDNRKREI